jgi:hypothetical protein
MVTDIVQPICESAWRRDKTEVYCLSELRYVVYKKWIKCRQHLPFRINTNCADINLCHSDLLPSKLNVIGHQHYVRQACKRYFKAWWVINLTTICESISYYIHYLYSQDKVFPYPEPTDDQQETLQMMIAPVERFFTEKGRTMKAIKIIY